MTGIFDDFVCETIENGNSTVKVWSAKPLNIAKNRSRETTQEEREAWRITVEAAAGGLSGAYPEGYLEEIREGWPD